MNILTAIYIGASFAYIFFGLYILFFLKKQQPVTANFNPHVSVIVACRNEARHLAQCLDSLSQLHYPRHLLEIIIVDDQSKDESAAIIQHYCSRFQHIHPLYIQKKIKPGKAGAILEGIAASTGEIICITDADCIVPQTWIKGLLEGFSENTGMVGGYTLLESKSNKYKIFHRVQSCDHLFLLGVASALSALNCPASWLGNNLAFRRSVYDEVGGYQKLCDSLVEDFALIKAVDSLTDWKINFTANIRSTIQSQPVNTIAELYSQRKRWASGISQTRAAGITIMAAAFITHLFQFLYLFSIPIQQWIFMFLAVVCIDMILLWRSAALVNRIDLMRYFFAFEIYYYVYTLLLPIFSVFDRKINWKGQHYKSSNFRMYK